jgi:hypothetical protein
LDATKANRLVRVTGSAVLIYAVYCLQMFLMQRQVIFPRYMIPSSQPPDFKNLRIEPWWLGTLVGKVDACYLPPATADKLATAVIFGHGNGELIDFWPNELGRFSAIYT